ncbi:MAG: hypothetical protein IPH07_33530 [Deltaproteobacteria bacterium]|nr:hypothetical protein [Deltaproteobacteria bacterium]MBK8716580.1 hypothetical protein [Deltaproteobacteria bacterium]MBP7289492.1 hypothetical protein [Nannocystaceae bacterium]
MSAGLPRGVVESAASAMATTAGFVFTRSQLFFELVRRGALADPGADLDGAMQAFESRLAAFEHDHGELEGLIRPERLVDLPPPPELPPDVLDYTVRRVLVFDRLDTCLFFVCNGFHRRIEVGLVVWPDGAAEPGAAGFPSHVCDRLRAQLDEGLPTDFFLIGDCGTAARSWRQRMHATLKRPHVRVRDASLTFPWAFRLRLPVRATGRAPDPHVVIPEDHEWRGLLMVGSYASLQEMPPMRLMRWVYRRVARGAEDVGFG